MSTDLPSDHWLETYKSLISISIEGFKFGALANGVLPLRKVAQIEAERRHRMELQLAHGLERNPA